MDSLRWAHISKAHSPCPADVELLSPFPSLPLPPPPSSGLVDSGPVQYLLGPTNKVNPVITNTGMQMRCTRKQKSHIWAIILHPFPEEPAPLKLRGQLFGINTFRNILLAMNWTSWMHGSAGLKRRIANFFFNSKLCFSYWIYIPCFLKCTALQIFLSTISLSGKLD